MLILTRKPGESVMVGNSVRITVTELSSGAVRLGFEAPAEVSIYREEIYHDIAEANRAAAGKVPLDAVGSGDGRGRR
jgi:carbon storage regulator